MKKLAYGAIVASLVLAGIAFVEAPRGKVLALNHSAALAPSPIVITAPLPNAAIQVGQSFLVLGTTTAPAVTISSTDAAGNVTTVQTIPAVTGAINYTHPAPTAPGPLSFTVSNGSGASVVVTVQVAALPIVSPDGTTVATIGPAIIDTQQRSFTLMAADASNRGQQIGVNGVRDVRTANAVKIYAKGGVAYHENASGSWYNLSAANVWQGPDADPTIVVPPPPPPGTATFDYEGTSFVTHNHALNGDIWGYVAPDTPDGRGGPNFGETTNQWWLNPKNASTQIPGVYAQSGSNLLLGVVNTPAANQAYINGQAGATMAPFVGALLYNPANPVSNTDGKRQLYGYFEVATQTIPRVPGFVHQFSLETYDHGWPPEIDVAIWTNSDSSTHARFIVNSGLGTWDSNPNQFDITQPHKWGINWQVDVIQFYVDGVQVFSAPNPGGVYRTSPLGLYVLTGAGYLYPDVSPNPASLPAQMAISSVKIFPNVSTQPPPPPPPPPTGASTDGATATDATTVLVTNDLTSWRLTAAGGTVQFAPKGTTTWAAAGLSANVVKIEKWTDGIYQSNAAGGWFRGSMASATAFGTWTQVAGDPSITAPPPPPPPPPGAGAFSISNGQIMRGGLPFVAKGLAMTYGGHQAADFTSHFPGLNAVMMWGNSPFTDIAFNSTNIAMVDNIVNAGLIAVISDYTPGGPSVRTGSDAQNAFAWYGQWAAHYKNQPLVWFTTQNEPNDDGAGSMTAYHQGVYNAVRGAGSPNIIMMEPDNTTIETWFGVANTIGLTPGTYANMTNVVWNMHCYPWTAVQKGFSASSGQQAMTNYTLGVAAKMMNFAHSADGAMPVIMGEGGNSSGGGTVDDFIINGKWAVVQSWLDGTGTATGDLAGFIAWIYDYQGNDPGDVDTFVDPSTGQLTLEGQQLAARAAQSP